MKTSAPSRPSVRSPRIRRGLVREAGLHRQPGGRSCDFVPAQGLQQVTGEHRALARPAREASIGEMLGALLQRVTHLGSEPAAGQSGLLTCDQRPIQPGRARRRHLSRQGQVRAHRQTEPLVAVGAGERPRLDNRANGGVAGRLQTPELDVVGATIDPLDHDVGRPLQLVMQSAVGEAPQDTGLSVAVYRERADIGVAVVATERPVHGPDDVAAHGHCAERRLEVGF